VASEQNRVIQGLWLGSELSNIERLGLASFVANGHEVHLYAYEEIAGVPDGVLIRDGSDIIPARRVFSSTRGGYTAFADWFRQELLFTRGGYWTDLDVICLRAFDFREEVVLGLEDEHTVSNAVMRFPAGHPLPRTLADLAQRPNTPLPYDNLRSVLLKAARRYLLGNRVEMVGWGEAAGPAGLSAALRHNSLMHLAKPPHIFYPISHRSWRSIFYGSARQQEKLLEGSYAVHLWNEMARREKGFDKNAVFAAGSLIEVLKARYSRAGLYADANAR
jgi:hypothetical protein